MRTSTPMTPGSWTRQPLSTLWKMGGLAGDYWAPPQMTLVPASTQFGRLEHAHGPLALLLTVSFRNESARHIWLHSVAIHDACTWYQPMPFLGDRVHLLSPQHQHDLPLPRTQSLITAPYIPASAVAERFALFRLPERWGFCRKVRFLGQNPKIWCQECNDLQTPELSKQQRCDRTLLYALPQ